MNDNLGRALPESGPISMSQVRGELDLAGPISLGQSQVRDLAGRPSGPISMSQLRGKSAGSAFTIKVGKSEHAGLWIYGFDSSMGVLVSDIQPIQGIDYDMLHCAFRYGWSGGQQVYTGHVTLRYNGPAASAPVFESSTLVIDGISYECGRTATGTGNWAKNLNIRPSKSQVKSLAGVLGDRYNKTIKCSITLK